MRDHTNPISVRRISFPATLFVSALIAVASAWGVAAVARTKLDDTAKDVAELKAAALPAAVETQHVRDRLEWLESNQQQQNRALDRIERHLGTK